MADGAIRTIDDLDVAGKTVLVRSDLNVPMAGGQITDDFRIRASLPTIRELLETASRVVVASHLGRPAGRDPDLSMKPVSDLLGSLGGFETILAPGVIGPDVERTITDADVGTVVVLENTRFEAGETSNDQAMAEGLARLADVFVNDAFGTAHRAHASNVGVASILESAAGRLLSSEIAAFDRVTSDPERPFVVVIGGAKVSDKLGLIEHLLPKVDLMLIGGAMCFTLLRAAGYGIGDSMSESAMVKPAERILASEYGDKIVLPLDIVVASSFREDASYETVNVSLIPSGTIGLDIGPKTVTRFSDVIGRAGTVLWNGPMGVFEWEAFRLGTSGVAAAVAACEGYTVVGGGDSVAAIAMLGLDSDVSHVSSGGGAGLALLEGSLLPGIEVLR